MEDKKIREAIPKRGFKGFDLPGKPPKPPGEDSKIPPKKSPGRKKLPPIRNRKTLSPTKRGQRLKNLGLTSGGIKGPKNPPTSEKGLDTPKFWGDAL